jgi:hypothetical protein
MKKGHTSMSSAGYERTVPMKKRLINKASCVTAISYLNDVLIGNNSI